MPYFLTNRAGFDPDAGFLSTDVHNFYEKLRKQEKMKENLRLYRELLS